MEDFIDLVICKLDSNHNLSIFRAPAWSYLSKGEKVLVETKKGEAEATVEKTYTVDVTNKNAFDFILMASGVSLPLRKVLKRIIFIDLDYENEGGENEKK